MRAAMLCALLLASGSTQAQDAKAKAAAKDAFGDRLPDGAFYRLGTVRLRHEWMRAVIFSADGSQLLSQGNTSDLRVWDVATARLLQQLACEGPTHLSASPDDKYLACVQENSQVLLLDKASGKEIARYKLGARVHALAFSKDGKELAALAADATVLWWNLATKGVSGTRLDMTGVDNKNPSSHWTLSPDGGIAAYKPDAADGAPGNPWHFWDTATGKQCRPPLKTQGQPYQMIWSPDGRLLAIIGSDNTVKVWDTIAGKRLPVEAGKRQEGGSYGPRCAAFHPNGNLLAIGIDGELALWDVAGGKKLWRKDGYGVLAFSPDGKTLAAAGTDIISLLETATGAPAGFSRHDPGSVALFGGRDSPSFLKDSRSFIVYDAAGRSQLETATGKRLRTYGKGFMIDVATGKELWRGPQDAWDIYVARDGKTLAALSRKQDEFTTFDVATGREITKVSVPVPDQRYVTFSAVADDLRTYAIAKNFGAIDLWDLRTGKKLRSLAGPEGLGDSMYFLPGGRMFVATIDPRFRASEEKGECTRVWDVATGRVIRSFREPLLKTSADGRWLALDGGHKGGERVTVIRHLQTGRKVATIGGSSILAFSPDGSMLAGRSQSGHEVELWDTFTGRQLCRWSDPLCRIYGAEFSPDGRTLLASYSDSMIACDVTGQADAPGKIAPQKLMPAEADRCWMEVMCDDGPRSHQARWRLVASGEDTVKLLERRLRRVEPVEELAALIAALDSGNFTQREKAFRTLEKMELARPALEESLQRGPSLEMKRRIEAILATQDALSWDAEPLRALRGVLLLEQIATPHARQLLQTLAQGAAGSLLTQEAQSALQRLPPVEKVR